jgi:GNAT superfamily N-acetyltransferase
MPVSTNIPGFSIRTASREDTPLILSFIKELAAYEKLDNEVTATVEELETCLFGEKKYAEVVIGEYHGTPVGFALFFHNFSTFLSKPGIYLEDLFVLEEFRGRGFGKELLLYLAWLAKERNCGRLEWSVLDWNEPAIRFYHSLGAKQMNEWIINRVTAQDLESLAGMFRKQV